MTEKDRIQPNQIFLLDGVYDKPRLLRELADHAAAALGLESEHLVAALLRREDLGSTGLGGGIAVPHARLPDLPRSFGILALLRTPAEFDAIDGRTVDVVFLQLAPDNAGMLKALAATSRTLREAELVDKLRRVSSARDAYELLDN